MKPPPKALVDVRPAVGLENTEPVHPEQGPNLGPPPKSYTPAVHEAIITAIRRGNRPHIAAAAAGISSNTFYRWMQLGRDNDPHLWKFAEDVETAMAIAEGNAVASIAGPDGQFAENPDNAKWWLERTRADGYSKEAATKVNAMLEEFFKRLESNLPALITQDMVGRPMFEIVLAAASGHTLASAKQTFQLHTSIGVSSDDQLASGDTQEDTE